MKEALLSQIKVNSTGLMRRINTIKFDEVYHVSNNDATLYCNITLLLLIGHAFFGTFVSINAVHRMNVVLTAIFLFLLLFPLTFIIACRFDSITVLFMMAALQDKSL